MSPNTCLIALLYTLYFTLSVASQSQDSAFVPAICKSSCGKNINETKTAEFCYSSHDLRLIGRCCINATQIQLENKTVVLGIDLQQCNMTEETFSSGIQELSHLQYISLEDNDIENITKTDFNRNTGIIYLSLPYPLHCPGGSQVWNVQNFTTTATFCWDELNPCQVYNITCPDNSHCEPCGVDLTECLCDPGYHGYKCMNKGTFPVLVFVIGIAVPSVLICLLLWVTQRRYVISVNKNK